ncbi:XkdX family protein [Niallia sp. 03190]|uniref:XkdX family protein n=1 Tax=Niallia sp. 03190 TaxID=3458061 RepID=UPI0040448E31
MNWYKMIKSYYEKGYWTEEQVIKAVECKKITDIQFKDITGNEYAVEQING